MSCLKPEFMFENLIRELEELKRMKKLSVPIKADKEGYLDRECPNKECQFQFKVQEDDWKNLFRDEQVFCPLCRHEAKADSWWTTQQINKAKDQIIKHIHGRIGRALEEGARDFNSRQSRNSFISMSVRYSGSRQYNYILPVPAKKEMLLKVICKECNSRYAVIGSAFFCPSCGHNSVEETFDNSLIKVKAKLKNLTLIRKAVEAISKDG